MRREFCKMSPMGLRLGKKLRKWIFGNIWAETYDFVSFVFLSGTLTLNNVFFKGFYVSNSIFLRLTVELAGKYALVGIYCLFRHVRWYVGD